MAKIEWDDRLSVGIEEIDNQHRKWIAHYNDVVDAFASPEAPEHVATTLEFLIDYTQTHFATEEKYMVENNYPEYDAHRAKHNELRKTIEDLVREFQEEGPTPLLARSVDTLLGNWLIRHIQEVDTRLGSFLATLA